MTTSPSTATTTTTMTSHASNRLYRLLRHRLLDEGDALAAIGGDRALTRIEQKVAASEARHSGQIRVCVEAGLPLSYIRKRATPRDRAVAMFGKLRVWDTGDNDGVLVYLLLAEHAIEIVADRGIDAKVTKADWQAIIDAMGEAFRQRRIADGLDAAIDAVDALLVRHFPRSEGGTYANELPDAPLLR